MSIADKLVVLGTKISNALIHANEALTAKGGSEANSLWEIGTKIGEIEVGGGDDSELVSFIQGEGETLFSNNSIANVCNYGFYDRKFTEINLPACSTVGTYAFGNCLNLTSINLPNCINLGKGAFSTCYSLTSVYFPNCEVIQDYCFRLAGLTNMCFPKCIEIGEMGFYYLQDLISIPSDAFPACEMIDRNAFAQCSSLKTVVLPACTSLSQSAFASCPSLQSVDLPNCSIIGVSAFYQCFSLTSISIPNCIKLESWAFTSCRSLSIIDLPSSLKSISGSCFYYCSALTTVILRSPSIVTLNNSRAFIYTPIQNSTYTGSFGSIYVPASLVASYQKATNWKYFSSRITAIVE